MLLLFFGLLLWSTVHLTPSVAPLIKRAWIDKTGEKGYSLSFAALIIIALVLIVLGWRNSIPVHVYTPPVSARPFAILLIALAFVLFGAANYATRIRRVVRHPQLTGLVCWSAGHLLANGDSRSIALFGWLGVWAILEMIFINRRDGEWIKQASPGWPRELAGFAISLAIFVAVVFAHPYISGVSVR